MSRVELGAIKNYIKSPTTREDDDVFIKCLMVKLIQGG